MRCKRAQESRRGIESRPRFGKGRKRIIWSVVCISDPNRNGWNVRYGGVSKRGINHTCQDSIDYVHYYLMPDVGQYSHLALRQVVLAFYAPIRLRRKRRVADTSRPRTCQKQGGRRSLRRPSSGAAVLPLSMPRLHLDRLLAEHKVELRVAAIIPYIYNPPR